MLFRQLFDPETSTYTYLIADLTTNLAVLVDPVIEQVERDVYDKPLRVYANYSTN
ncbi:hypothetical protein NIES2107_00450 [Nostoc carneum NIES-2107]|nr:hypothetical protein NIES2107_00450 [Nostoc carneum NIES-2107]